MKKLFLTTALALSISFSAQADMTPPEAMPAGVYVMDPHHASVVWRVDHFGLSSYVGSFHKVEATLNYDPKDPANSKLVATVDMSSVKVDIATKTDKKDKYDSNAFAKELVGAKWFHSSKFPKATFVSTKIESTGDKTADVSGNLTFMGKTRPLTLKVTFNGAYAQQPISKMPELGFSATATVKRSDWGVKEYLGGIGDDVDLTINAEFVQMKK